MRSDDLAPLCSANSDIVIRIDKLWKHYGLAAALGDSGRRLLGMKENDAGPWALQDISLEVKRGQTLGLLGRNGAGKSSLLKVLAGVTRSTRGTVSAASRMFPMIELNAGMNTELTGRENVRILGALMGMSRRSVERRMPDFEDFCELGEWFDRPVRTYSSGMQARLGFSVAMNVDADILLIDEVLAVGDLAFQNKCYEALWKKRKQGATTLFVSHNLRQVERICDQVMWLEKGRMRALGKANIICAKYSSTVRYRPEIASESTQFNNMRTIRDIILTVEAADEAGTISTGGTLRLELSFHSEAPIEAPIFVFQIYSADMICVSSITNLEDDRPDQAAGLVRATCLLPSLSLLPGTYAVSVKVRSGNEAVLIEGDRVRWFEVVDESFLMVRSAGGLVRMDSVWSHGEPRDEE